ncbi:MFS transporter [Nitratireductor sp. XY-223]|uniref:MFS transporter n=1 Tax=Nitratireductor sp. XY-223 TaxID=2561926 RepID=UPI0010AAABD9|nr:MFS transporter [Nitratireductor sp. XY-223]
MMSQRLIVVYCGLLMSISAFSVDITLPAFPAMMAQFSTGFAQVQWTVTAYIFAAGCGQLVWGSVSDRYGRKITLAFGLSGLLVGQFLAVFAPNIELLLLARVLQGLGAASAIVICRAILRDLFSGRELARNMAMASAVFAVGPMLAPLLGAVIIDLVGWRYIFVGLACLTAVLIVMLAFFRETLAEPNVHALRPARIRSNMAALFSHPQSCFFLIVSTLAMAFMLLILTGAPAVYETEFGITGLAFAGLFAIHGVGIICGQFINRRLINSMGVIGAVVVSSAVMAVMSGLYLALAVGDLLVVFLLPILFAIPNGAYLVFYSNATSLVLDPHHERAGFAASLFGFVSQLGGALLVSVLVIFGNDNAVGMATLMFALAVVMLAAVAVRYGRKQPVREV